jgi:hypothetical protein
LQQQHCAEKQRRTGKPALITVFFENSHGEKHHVQRYQRGKEQMGIESQAGMPQHRPE